MKNFNIENIDINLKLKYKKIPTTFGEKLHFYFKESPFVWETLDDIHFNLSNGQHIVVPKGLEFDLASIPPFLTGFIKEYNTCLPAYILHDFLYINDIILKDFYGQDFNDYENRLFIDKEMLRFAILYNPSQERIHKLKYRMVRLFGKKVYDKKKDEK
jgi:hypothetical protein